MTWLPTSLVAQRSLYPPEEAAAYSQVNTVIPRWAPSSSRDGS